MSLLKKYLEFRKRLAYKLITYYGLLLILLITISFNLDRFDARNFSPVSVKDQIYFKNESLQTQQNLDIDKIFENNLSVETENGFDVILEDKETGNLSGVNQSNIKALQSFIYQSLKTEEPLQRRFENSEIYGPFVVYSKTHTYNQYFIKAVDAQEEWINIILDSPLLMAFLLMFAAAPLLIWLSLKITRPVKNLTISANSVATGNLETDPRLETEGIYEIREVGKSFNHMVQNIRVMTEAQQRMISDISHELKTPLARLQLTTAILRRKIGETTEITRIENEIDKLDKMIKDLLEISRQQLNYQKDKAIFPINEIWETILEDMKFEASQNDIIFVIKQNIKYPERHFINGSVNSLSSAVENLLRNGQKYAERTLSISININNGYLYIIVEDDGKGVPESEYENIFKPFYRVDEARTRATGGTGLGLAIVQNTVKQHLGHIQATKSKLGGLRIRLKIPLWTQET